MEAKSDVNFVMKNWGAYSLLTITVAMATIGSSLSRKAIESNNAVTPLVGDKATSQLAEDKSHICAVIGTEAVLNCPRENYDLIVWNIELKNGTNCHISYMSKNDTTERNCTENMNWLSRPDQRPDLRIQSPQLFSEGTYKCSVVTINGTFNYKTILSILVPPKVSLTHSINRTAVCIAAAGKPAATISWDPPGHFVNAEEIRNDTYMVTSRYNYTSTSEGEVSCSISHPAWNESRTLKISFDPFLCGNNFQRTTKKGKILLGLALASKYTGERNYTMKILYSSLTGLLGILVLLLFIYFWKLFHGRQPEAAISESPEAISGEIIQEDELEPYATFVQVENIIYDKARDFSQGGECFPPGFLPST